MRCQYVPNFKSNTQRISSWVPQWSGDGSLKPPVVSLVSNFPKIFLLLFSTEATTERPGNLSTYHFDGQSDRPSHRGTASNLWTRLPALKHQEDYGAWNGTTVVSNTLPAYPSTAEPQIWLQGNSRNWSYNIVPILEGHHRHNYELAIFNSTTEIGLAKCF